MGKRIQNVVVALAVGDDGNWDITNYDLENHAKNCGFSIDAEQCNAIRNALFSFLSEANIERHEPAASEALRIASSLAKNAEKLRSQLERLDRDYSSNWVSLSHVGYPLNSYRALERDLRLFELKARESRDYLSRNSTAGDGRRKRPGLEQLVWRMEKILSPSGVNAKANFSTDLASVTSPFVRFLGSLLAGMPKEVHPGNNGLGDAVRRILSSAQADAKTVKRRKT